MKNVRFFLLVALLLFAIVWVGPGLAFNPQPEPPGDFGMIGVTPYETARLNVVTNDTSLTQGCTIGLGYQDAMGMLLKTEFKALRPGVAQSLDLMGIDAVGRGEMRAEIQPFVNSRPTGRPSGFPPGPCRGVTATFELFDPATGRTSVAIAAPQRAGNGN